MTAERVGETDKITKFENKLDGMALALANDINEAAMPVRLRNNARWEEFARICRTPVIGELYFRRVKYPQDLEEEPKKQEVPYYAERVKAIIEGAERLEAMKAQNMNIYGDEIVETMWPGVYDAPPMRVSRRNCYEELKLVPLIPEKYDFSSAAGADKTKKGRLVMDAVTKKLVEETECKFILANREVGIRYSVSPMTEFKIVL